MKHDFKVGEIVEIIWAAKQWAGKREITEVRKDGVTVYSKELGCDGWFAFKNVNKLKITNWRQRIK